MSSYYKPNGVYHMYLNLDTLHSFYGSSASTKDTLCGRIEGRTFILKEGDVCNQSWLSRVWDSATGLRCTKNRSSKKQSNRATKSCDNTALRLRGVPLIWWKHAERAGLCSKSTARPAGSSPASFWQAWCCGTSGSRKTRGQNPFFWDSVLGSGRLQQQLAA